MGDERENEGKIEGKNKRFFSRDNNKRSDKRDSERDIPHIRLSLLDPFTQRGILGTKYGTRVFGSEADYCEHYMNTDDPGKSWG